MKNNGKKQNNVKTHLTNKGKKAQMRNKRREHIEGAKKKAAPAIARPKMEKAQKVFIALVALVCAFAISFLTLGTIVLVDIANDVKYGSVYDEIRLSDYIHISKNLYKDNDVDLSGYYREPYTLEDMDDYLESLRYEHRKEIAKGKMTSPLGYGDDFAYFIVAVEQDGKLIMTNDWAASNYVTPLSMTVGSSLFGDDFDAKLAALGVCPNDTDLELRENGTLEADDVIILSYDAYNVTTFYEDTSKCVFNTNRAKAVASSRVDLAKLAEKDKALADALVSGCLAIGESFEVILKDYDLDANGTIETAEKAVKLAVTVSAAVEKETVARVTFTVPEGYFDEKANGADYAAVNGKEITVSLIILAMDDYELPALDAAFIKETLKFETDKTADAEVIAAYKEHALAELNDNLEKTLLNAYTSELLNRFGSAASQNGAYAAGKYPEGTYEDAYYEAYDNMIAAYVSYYGTSPADQSSFDTFVQSYVYKTYGAQVQGVSDYCAQQAQSQVAQELLMYYIFRKEHLKISDEQLEEGYREYVDSLIRSYGNEETYNEEYFIEQYGKDTLYANARRKILVYRAVGKYLLEQNNITYIAEEKGE